MNTSRDTSAEGGPTIEDRLISLVEQVGGISKAAQLCGVTRNTLYTWTRGTARIPLDAAIKLCGQTSVSLDWLVAGGDADARGTAPLTSSTSPEPVAAIPRVYADVAIPIDTTGFFDAVYISEIDARASAGHGAWNDRSVEVRRIAFPITWLRRLGGDGVNAQKCDFLRVQGDSMMPTIADKALLLVDRNQTKPPPAKRRRRKQDDDIFVFLWEGDLKVKRLARLPDLSLIVFSDNTADYPPEVIDRHAPAVVLGRVIWWDNRL